MTVNGLIYLRSRYYNPMDGRFVSRDTWGGNSGHPMSFNRWNYVGGNPVNLTDPSGNFPPIWCQMMPNKAMYEGCVDLWYGIEPISYFKMGENVTGGVGCYKGPTSYRAPGYIEGTGLTFAYIANGLFAAESVYDFATMEHNYFVNGASGVFGVPGVGGSDFIAGISGNEYAGYVYGFRYEKGYSINSDYPGPFIEGYIGASVSPVVVDFLGISIGTGTIGFISPSDPMIRGYSHYISFSLGLDAMPLIADGGLGVISTMELNKEAESYLDPNDKTKVLSGKLYSDILFGKHNEWLTRLGLTYFAPADLASRVGAAYKSLKYAAAYEDLHDKNK
jgi:RHS repeat-associated protein